MPAAIPKPIRQQIVRRHRAGESLADIARELALSYRTVSNLWARFRRLGEPGLGNSYALCGRKGPGFEQALYQETLDLRRAHPHWGAALVRVRLSELHPDEPDSSLPATALPASRTIASWLKAAGLAQVRTRKPKGARVDRAKAPHEVWEIDAKERMRLSTGSGLCQLSISDEASGAALGAVAFPPRALEPRPAEGLPGRSPSALRAVGPARKGPARQRPSLG